jgi:hypothetical protein
MGQGPSQKKQIEQVKTTIKERVIAYIRSDARYDSSMVEDRVTDFILSFDSQSLYSTDAVFVAVEKLLPKIWRVFDGRGRIVSNVSVAFVRPYRFIVTIYWKQ